MDIQKIFERLGLPRHSDKVYKTLRDHGPLSPTQICQMARLHRPAVYRALSPLSRQSFIFTVKTGKRKLYRAADANVISQTFAQLSSRVAKNFARREIAGQTYHENEIRFLSGFNGIRAAFDDVISHMDRGGTFFRYTSEKDLDKVNRYLAPDYRLRRDQKKLERLVISNPFSGMRKKPRLERFVKYILPEADIFDQNIIQIIYGRRLLFIDLNTERVLIIDNIALADFQKVIFKQLYRRLPLPASHPHPANEKQGPKP